MLVLLSFDDDEQAKTLIEDLYDYPDARLLTPSQENDVDAKLVAVYKMPTMFHEPFDTHGGKKTEVGFTKGQKWGWWVCQMCKKPSRMYWESITKLECSFGKNILHTLLPEKEEENVGSTQAG